MPRRKKCRRVFFEFPVFSGVVEFTPDELEALRLADIEGLSQIEAAKLMGVSQPTFHRILKEARKKASMAVLGGKPVIVPDKSVMRIFQCFECGHEWSESYESRPEECPKCGSARICGNANFARRRRRRGRNE